MMRRIYGYLVMISLLVLVTAAPALSDTYFIYNQYGGTWQDANKTTSSESNLCWAAAAANILAYEGWGTSTYNTATSIFQYFANDWSNKTGYMAWAWNWWFSGTKPLTAAYAYPVVAGGKFFPALNLNNYFYYASTGNLMSTADSLLHNGDGVTMTIRDGSLAHAVTLRGFSYSSPGTYTGIYITDSDDGAVGLENYSVTSKNNIWYLSGRYNGWTISDIEALGPNASALVKNGVISPAGNSSPVPIAPSWVLFGTGAAALFLRRRRGPGRPETPAT